MAARHLAVAAVVLAAALCWVRPAGAAVAVGDKPALQFDSANGMGAVSLERLRGKIVVVDFWATWCGPCMAEADHMVKLHQEYGPKGVQLIGISLDRSAPPMLQVSKEKGFDWPQALDTGSRISREWGVSGIPSTFIISPEGAVLWKGHPAQIDGPLADALKQHPPQMVDPKVMAAATAAADKAEAAFKEGSGAAAVKALASVPAAARKDPKFAARLEDLAKQADEYAAKAMAEVEPLVEAKDYVGAMGKLSDLAKGLGNTPAGEKARKRLAELGADPKVKAAFEAAQKAKAADEELAVAKRLQADKKDEQAYVKFKGIVTAFPGTPAAEQAKAAVAEYEKNPALVKRAADSAVSAKAKAALGMADNYRRAGRPELAKKKYEEVISQYPGTSFAEEAKKAIEELK